MISTFFPFGFNKSIILFLSEHSLTIHTMQKLKAALRQSQITPEKNNIRNPVQIKMTYIVYKHHTVQSQMTAPAAPPIISTE